MTDAMISLAFYNQMIVYRVRVNQHVLAVTAYESRGFGFIVAFVLILVVLFRRVDRFFDVQRFGSQVFLVQLPHVIQDLARLEADVSLRVDNGSAQVALIKDNRNLPVNRDVKIDDEG
jgi:hypothetical protein